MYGQGVSLHARQICRPLAPRSLPASSLLQPAPPPAGSSRWPRAEKALVPPILPSQQNLTGFPSSVAPLCTLASAYDPGVWLLSGFVSLTAPTPVACWVAQPIGSPKRLSRLTAFTCRFRLGCFAVYASTHWLPPELQDSLPGGADFSFQGRTFTRQWCAALLGARAIALSWCMILFINHL